MIGKVILLTGTFLVSLMAYPISHIGRGKLSSPVSLYAAQVPSRLKIVRPLAGGGLQLQGGQYLKSFGIRGPLGSSIGVAQLAVYEPASLYPELRELPGRDAIKEELIRRGWKISVTDLPCASFALEETRDGLYHRILLWGKDKGIVFVGTAIEQMKKDILEIEASILLENGACQWN